jgi:hypothetical protein
MIWEIDGAVDKVCISSCIMKTSPDVSQLFCQNLALFGKLFIDVKTLFFDTENCPWI